MSSTIQASIPGRAANPRAIRTSRSSDRQNLDGPLFLIAAFNPEPAIAPGGGEDFLDLYRVHVDKYGRPGTRLLSHIERKHVTTNSIGGDTAHFAGSTGVYVSPSGELIVYSTEHTNQGPVDENGRHTVRGGEWRHREMVRPDNPTLRPTVDAPVFTVDEGGSRTLVGRGRPPLTRAWLQLFIDDGLGLSDSHFNTEVAIDYDDRNKDDFDDFFRLLWYFNDEASSWRWFAPQGCTIQASQHDIRDDDFPGRYKTLLGQGTVTAATNLDEVQSDNAPGSMNDMISAVGFSCGTYYTTPVTVSWDLDRNDSYETFGETALFSAAALDGPSTVEIPCGPASHRLDAARRELAARSRSGRQQRCANRDGIRDQGSARPRDGSRRPVRDHGRRIFRGGIVHRSRKARHPDGGDRVGRRVCRSERELPHLQ